MGRLEDLIERKEKEDSYELECLMAYKEILDSGNCNDCATKWKCEIAPKPGQLVRFNCYRYISK